MHFRSVLSGTLALLLVSSVAAPAVGNEQGTEKSGFSFRLPTFGIFGEKKKPDQVQYAQDGTGSTALQEQLRQMNGKIEELNFQVLQMQE
ncbi:MAG: tol-pal system protein YbgF, partial [Mesorhizobium sp.]